MSDDSIIGSFVFIVTFMGIFIILVSTMPAQFYSSAPTYQQYAYPDFFSQEDIEHFRHIASINVTKSTFPYVCYYIDFNDETPPADFKFQIHWRAEAQYNKIQIAHVHYEFWVFIGAHPLNILIKQDEGQRYISKSLALEYWDEESNATSLHPVFCDHITVKVWLTDPNSTRNDIAEAWDEGTVQLTIGFGFSDYETTISGWDVVGRLLIFQAPDIHPVVNAIIALPMWACIAILIYILILKAIPFVGD